MRHITSYAYQVNKVGSESQILYLSPKDYLLPTLFPITFMLSSSFLNMYIVFAVIVAWWLVLVGG